MSRGHEIVTIAAGASAMRDLATGEVMHPGVGPLVEAEQLYVGQSRLGDRLREEKGGRLVLFDVGLGAGSNAVAARAVSERACVDDGHLEIVSFERDLGAFELALAHPAAFGFTQEAAAAGEALLRAGRHETARTTWRLAQGDLREALVRETVQADVVFWDPFSPRANPELWTVAAFSSLRAVAGSRCTLYTYSASTAVRAALLLAGWAVGFGDGIGRKAETTAAAVRLLDLKRPLDRRWLERLARSTSSPTDAGPDAATRIAAAPQFVHRPASSRA